MDSDSMKQLLEKLSAIENRRDAFEELRQQLCASRTSMLRHNIDTEAPRLSHDPPLPVPEQVEAPTTPAMPSSFVPTFVLSTPIRCSTECSNDAILTAPAQEEASSNSTPSLLCLPEPTPSQPIKRSTECVNDDCDAHQAFDLNLNISAPTRCLTYGGTVVPFAGCPIRDASITTGDIAQPAGAIGDRWPCTRLWLEPVPPHPPDPPNFSTGVMLLEANGFFHTATPVIGKMDDTNTDKNINIPWSPFISGMTAESPPATDSVAFTAVPSEIDSMCWTRTVPVEIMGNNVVQPKVGTMWFSDQNNKRQIEKPWELKPWPGELDSIPVEGLDSFLLQNFVIALIELNAWPDGITYSFGHQLQHGYPCGLFTWAVGNKYSTDNYMGTVTYEYFRCALAWLCNLDYSDGGNLIWQISSGAILPEQVHWQIAWSNAVLEFSFAVLVRWGVAVCTLHRLRLHTVLIWLSLIQRQYSATVCLPSAHVRRASSSVAMVLIRDDSRPALGVPWCPEHLHSCGSQLLQWELSLHIFITVRQSNVVLLGDPCDGGKIGRARTYIS